jgi:FtsP/CotA-like multicopper oxidase with cupredoxin domain
MAERADVIVDFSSTPVGTSLYLLNSLEQSNLQQLVRFDVTVQQTDDSSIPSQLSNPGFLTAPSNATTRTWTLGLQPPSPGGGGQSGGLMWTINGLEFDPNRSDASVPLDVIEFWRFQNDPRSGMLHPAHVHLAHFQIMQRNGGPPLAHETGWKDTVALQPGEEALVMLRFEQFRGRYLFHCHNLEHEDHAMMSRFDVV